MGFGTFTPFAVVCGVAVSVMLMRAAAPACADLGCLRFGQVTCHGGRPLRKYVPARGVSCRCSRSGTAVMQQSVGLRSRI